MASLSDSGYAETERCVSTLSEDILEGSDNALDTTELYAELAHVNRKLEALTFTLKYVKAEQRESMKIKDKELHELEEQLFSKDREVEDYKAENDGLRQKVIEITDNRDFLYEKIKKLESEKDILLSNSKAREAKIGKLMRQLAELHHELNVAEKLAGLERLVEEQQRRAQEEMRHQMEVNTKCLQEQMHELMKNQTLMMNELQTERVKHSEEMNEVVHRLEVMSGGGDSTGADRGVKRATSLHTLQPPSRSLDLGCRDRNDRSHSKLPPLPKTKYHK